jgi:hypothetical protein
VSRLAIIIPHFGNVPALENTVASVLANRPEDCEVFVVLLRPYDDPYEVTGEVRFVSGNVRGGLAGAMNLGLRLSDAPAIHVLLCGTEVQEGWADAALTHLDDSRIAAVAPLVLDIDDPGRVVAAGLAYHVGGAAVPLAAGQAIDSLGANPKRVLAPHPAAAFYRRSALEVIGGFHGAAGDLLAGVDAGLTLEHLGLATVLEPRSRVAAPRSGGLRAGRFRRALEAERMFWRWAPVLGRARSLASHGVMVIGDGLCGLLNLSIVPRWTGRLAGACLAVSEPDRRQALDKLRETFRAQQAEPSAPSPHFRTPRPNAPRADARRLRRSGSTG